MLHVMCSCVWRVEFPPPMLETSLTCGLYGYQVNMKYGSWRLDAGCAAGQRRRGERGAAGRPVGDVFFFFFLLDPKVFTKLFSKFFSCLGRKSFFFENFSIFFLKLALTSIFFLFQFFSKINSSKISIRK